MDIVIKPIIEAIDGGWQGFGHLYGFSDNSKLVSATERFNAYDDRQEAWSEAKKSASQFAQNHNSTCKCGNKMIVGSY